MSLEASGGAGHCGFGAFVENGITSEEGESHWLHGDGEPMILNIFLTLIAMVFLTTIFFEALTPLLEMFFPQTVTRWRLRKKRIELDKIEQENYLLEQKKEAIEKQKALEDFLREHNIQ